MTVIDEKMVEAVAEALRQTEFTKHFGMSRADADTAALVAILAYEAAKPVAEPVAFMAHDQMRAITQRELDTIPEDDRRARCKALYQIKLYAPRT